MSKKMTELETLLNAVWRHANQEIEEKQIRLDAEGAFNNAVIDAVHALARVNDARARLLAARRG